MTKCLSSALCSSSSEELVRQKTAHVNGPVFSILPVFWNSAMVEISFQKSLNQQRINLELTHNVSMKMNELLTTPVSDIVWNGQYQGCFLDALNMFTLFGVSNFD
jgi:hypothetical protein